MLRSSVWHKEVSQKIAQSAIGKEYEFQAYFVEADIIL